MSQPLQVMEIDFGRSAEPSGSSTTPVQTCLQNRPTGILFTAEKYNDFAHVTICIYVIAHKSLQQAGREKPFPYFAVLVRPRSTPPRCLQHVRSYVRTATWDDEISFCRRLKNHGNVKRRGVFSTNKNGRRTAKRRQRQARFTLLHDGQTSIERINVESFTARKIKREELAGRRHRKTQVPWSL